MSLSSIDFSNANISARTIAAVKARDQLDQQRQIARNNLNKNTAPPDKPKSTPGPSKSLSPAPPGSFWGIVRKLFGF